MRKVSSVAILICSLLMVVSASWAQSNPYWSTGPKVGYTFGQQGGFAAGWELSYFPSQTPRGIIIGYTADFTVWHEHSTIHLGIEGPGLDLGPTAFFSKNDVRFGASAIAWFGLFLYPYYEFAWPIGQTPFHSVGGYLKFPIGYQNTF